MSWNPKVEKVTIYGPECMAYLSALQWFKGQVQSKGQRLPLGKVDHDWV